MPKATQPARGEGLGSNPRLTASRIWPPAILLLGLTFAVVSALLKFGLCKPPAWATKMSEAGARQAACPAHRARSRRPGRGGA